jgi:hypothetical protein
MKPFSKPRSIMNETQAQAPSADDWRLDRLIDRLPKRARSAIRFLRQPSGRWLRIPAGLMLTLGGLLWFLPIVGLWMLPMGLVLLADDVQPLRSLRSHALDWVEHHRPNWIADESARDDP